jgi:hypothetical protein
LDAMLCPDGSSVSRGGPNCEFDPCPIATACPLDAMVCPDGSSVSRGGPNCEFDPCPTVPPSGGCPGPAAPFLGHDVDPISCQTSVGSECFGPHMDAYQTELCRYMCKRCPCHVSGEDPTMHCRGTADGMCIAPGFHRVPLPTTVIGRGHMTYSEVCGELGEGWHGGTSGPGGPGIPGIAGIPGSFPNP